MVAKAMIDAHARPVRDFAGHYRSHHVLEAGQEFAASMCARYLATGQTGLAYAHARIHSQLLASEQRMFQRWDARHQAATA
jgi:hypothetical protein